MRAKDYRRDSNRPTVVLSAGHRKGGDPGACAGGLCENTAVEAPIVSLASEFASRGWNVVITRGADTSSRSNQLSSRPETAKQLGADLFVEVHGESLNPSRRILSLYTDNNEPSRMGFNGDGAITSSQPSTELAKHLVERLTDTLPKTHQSYKDVDVFTRHDGFKVKGKTKEFTVLDSSKHSSGTRSILIEYANMNNGQDRNRFTDPKAVHAFAERTAAATTHFYNEEAKVTGKPTISGQGNIFVHHSETDHQPPLIGYTLKEGKLIKDASLAPPNTDKSKDQLVAKTHELYAKINQKLHQAEPGLNLLNLDHERIKAGEFSGLKKDITDLQTNLNALGAEFRVGKPDGIPGNNTKRALLQFEIKHTKPPEAAAPAPKPAAIGELPSPPHVRPKATHNPDVREI